MYDLKLVRISQTNLMAFEQYIPGDIVDSLSFDDMIAIGCVYENLSCGAIVVQLENDGDCRLLSIYVDKNFRNRKVATYMFSGMMHELDKLNADRLYFCYTNTDIKDFGQLQFLSKLGFDDIRKNGISYTLKYNNLKSIKMLSKVKFKRCFNTKILKFSDLDNLQKTDYQDKVEQGIIPQYLSFENAKGNIIPELSLVALKENSVVGILSVTELKNYLYINSLYTIDNSYNALINLIKYALFKSETLIKDDINIKITACNEVSQRLCNIVLNDIDKTLEEEYLMECYL